MDTALALLKLTAIFVSGIAGVLALLVEYKDKDGEITRWGRRALLIVIASTIIAVVIQGIEIRRDRRAAALAEATQREALARNELLLTSIRTSLLRLGGASISATLRFPLVDPPFDAYAKRLLPSALQQPTYVDGDGNGWKRLTIRSGEAHYLRGTPAAYLLRAGVEGTVTHRDPGEEGYWQFRAFNAGGSPDLEFWHRTSGASNGDGQSFIEWTLSGPVQTLHRTPRILTLVDLVGAAVHMRPDDDLVYDGGRGVFLGRDISVMRATLTAAEFPLAIHRTGDGVFAMELPEGLLLPAEQHPTSANTR